MEDALQFNVIGTGHRSLKVIILGSIARRWPLVLPGNTQVSRKMGHTQLLATVYQQQPVVRIATTPAVAGLRSPDSEEPAFPPPW